MADLGSPPWYVRSEARSMGHTGPLMGPTGGRADKLPIAVPSGSHVIPADVVGSLGQGNTAAGMKVLGGMFSGPYGSQAPKIAHGMSKPPRMPHFADGGNVGKPVDIMASDGEYVVPPEAVAHIGNGDHALGHDILDHWILHERQNHINTLAGLPAPATD